MSFSCDAQTRSELNAATSKDQWATIISNALGLTRRIRCFRDADSAATSPASTGVEFRNVGSTGALKIVGGKIVGLGRIKGTTISLPADMTTGKSVLRIEGNGRWIQGTLGKGDGFDFGTNGSFTATNGLGVRPDLAISGRRFLPSGTGPIAPDLDPDAPVAFRLISYINPNSPQVVGTASASQRDLDIVLEHPQLANAMGDIRVQRVPDGGGVVFDAGSDSFRFTMTVLTGSPQINGENASKPLHQVLINAAPHNRWQSFPFKRDFDINNDILAPRPFKIEVLRANGSVLHIFEMYSTRTNDQPGTGWAINGQPLWDIYTTPVKPWWTCQMTLFWQSARPKTNPKMNHYLPPVVAPALHPRNVIAFDSAPEQWPVLTGNYLANGLGAWRMSPKWSRKFNDGPDTADVDQYYLQPGRENWITQWIGYGYEPGSTCHHTWYMSPGGSRHDRAPWPHAIVAWASDPTAIRPHGKVPMETMKDEWLKGYFNHGSFYYPTATLEAGTGIPKAKVLNGLIAYNDTYYNGGNENFVPDIENNGIRLLTAMNQQHDNYLYDKYGRSFTNQFQRDALHSHNNAACGAYVTLSPAHVIAARHSFTSHVLAQWGLSGGGMAQDALLTREHAWHNWQLSQAWVVGSTDARLFSREDIETMWQRHLHAVYDVCYPDYKAKLTDRAKAWHGYGIGGVLQQEASGAYRWALDHDSKTFYFGQTIMFMKQSGAWDAMKARSEKCRLVLEMWIEMLAVGTIDCYLDGKGVYDGENYWNLAMGSSPPGVKPEPKWSVWPKPAGSATLIHHADGSLRGGDGYPEGYNTQHFRAQALFILDDYFSEYHSNPKLARIKEARTLVQGWYDILDNNMVNNSGPFWHWRFANYGIHTKAAQIGPPTV